MDTKNFFKTLLSIFIIIIVEKLKQMSILVVWVSKLDISTTHYYWEMNHKNMLAYILTDGLSKEVNKR